MFRIKKENIMDIESIIKSLEKAENDNQKFALLLILSSLIKSNKLEILKQYNSLSNEISEQSKALNKRLFSAINPHFLARLLTTRQSVENESPLLYKSLSLSILTQFLDFPGLLADPILLSKLEHFADILRLKFRSSNDTLLNNDISEAEKEIVLDVLKYFFALSKHIPNHLCQNVGLLELIMNEIILNPLYKEKKDTSQQEQSQIQVIYDYERSEYDSDLKLVACKLFVSLCQDRPDEDTNERLDEESILKKQKRIESCLLALINECNSNQGEFKFSLIIYLNYFLSNNFLKAHFQRLEKECTKKLFNVLNDLFKSKLNETYKDLALALLFNFVKLFEFESIYLINRKFFYLLIHLICIQISLNVQSDDFNKKIVDNANMLNKMSILYSLLEDVIVILSTASPFDYEKSENESTSENSYDDSDHDDEEEESLEPELRKVITVVVDALEIILTYIKDTLNETKNKEIEESSNCCMMVFSSIRLLVCWLAHEGLLEDEILHLMPDIIDFCQRYHTNLIKQSQINIYELIIPGLERVLNDQQEKLSRRKSMGVMARSKSKSKLDDEVKYEFEIQEIQEKIESISKLIDTCKQQKPF